MAGLAPPWYAELEAAMRYFPAISAVFVVAAVYSVASSQSASRCALTTHPGTSDADAQVATRIACEELRDVSLPADHWFGVSMVPYGDSLMVCARENGASPRVRGLHCRWAAGTKASPGWAARIAQEFQPKPQLKLAPGAPRDTVERKTWYGWQTLTVVGVSLVPWIVAAEGKSVPPGYLVAGASGLFLGPPIVHLSHGNWGRALGSLAMGALPAALLLGVAGSVPCDDSSRDCNGPPANATLAIYAGLGHMIAYVIADSAGLAWDYAPVRPPPGSASLMPSLALTRNGATVGLGASF